MRKSVSALFDRFGGAEKNPYQFLVHGRAAQKQEDRAVQLSEEERFIVREQQRTVFDGDEAMQRLFDRDFEEYCRAMDNPDVMLEKLDERMQQSAHKREQGAPPAVSEDMMALEPGLYEDDELSIEIADMPDDDSDFTAEDDPFPFEDDPLYKKAYDWSIELHQLGHRLYDIERHRDSDLFRVTINVFMVSAKIAYASGIGEEMRLGAEADEELDEIEAEISLRGYGLCVTFLARVRESLVRLIQKGFEPVAQWQESLRVAEEIALEVHKRMFELKKKLRK